MNISLESLIILLIVAAVVGTLAQLLSGYARGGLPGSIVLGFIGALIGTWCAREFGLPKNQRQSQADYRRHQRESRLADR
jgi:uncharacterized membrane protein YeaQ/YmgE (transglycosylase-associated protein family)